MTPTAIASARITVEVASNTVMDSRFIDLAVGSAAEWNNRAGRIANDGDLVIS